MQLNVNKNFLDNFAVVREDGHLDIQASLRKIMDQLNTSSFSGRPPILTIPMNLIINFKDGTPCDLSLKRSDIILPRTSRELFGIEKYVICVQICKGDPYTSEKIVGNIIVSDEDGQLLFTPYYNENNYTMPLRSTCVFSQALKSLLACEKFK